MKKLINNRLLLLIIILAFALRFYVCFGTGLPWFSVDSINYINQAKALLNGDYQYYFPNGYPLLISFFVLISSIVPLHIGLIFLNICLSAVAVVLVYYITVKFLTDNKYLPLITTGIAAFYPNQLNYVRLILSEVPATFFLILSLYLFMNGRIKSAGLSIGFTSTIRTTLLPISFLFAAYLFFKRKTREAILFLTFSIVPMFVFLIYGYYKTGEFTLFIDTPKLFYISLGLDAVPEDFWTGLKNYFGYLIAHPLDFIYDRIISLWDMWGFLPDASDGLRSNILFRMLIAIRFPLLLLAIYGFIKSCKNYIAVYLILPALTITFIHAFIITSANEAYIANPRYIFPTEPFLIVLAVIGLNNLLNNALSNEEV